jgi:hypothetical protein
MFVTSTTSSKSESESESESKSEIFCTACVSGNVPEIIRMLKEDLNLANAHGMVREDHREFMKKLGAEGGWSALHLAAHYGQLNVVQILIEAGANLNSLAENNEANTPLMAAVAGGQIEIVSQLVKSGADPLRTDADGRANAITLAEIDKKFEIAALLKTASRFAE